MKTDSRVIWILTAFALLLMLGWFLVRQGDGVHWTVEVQREDASTGSASEEGDWPDSLLEGEVININTASAVDLQRLPGIGPERAEAIVTERQERGAFASTDDLLRVDGIGAGMLEQLRPYVTVGEN